jgi:hypothetical protein
MLISLVTLEVRVLVVVEMPTVMRVVDLVVVMEVVVAGVNLDYFPHMPMTPSICRQRKEVVVVTLRLGLVEEEEVRSSL